MAMNSNNFSRIRAALLAKKDEETEASSSSSASPMFINGTGTQVYMPGNTSSVLLGNNTPAQTSTATLPTLSQRAGTALRPGGTTQSNADTIVDMVTAAPAINIQQTVARQSNANKSANTDMTAGLFTGQTRQKAQQTEAQQPNTEMTAQQDTDESWIRLWREAPQDEEQDAARQDTSLLSSSSDSASQRETNETVAISEAERNVQEAQAVLEELGDTPARNGFVDQAAINLSQALRERDGAIDNGLQEDDPGMQYYDQMIETYLDELKSAIDEPSFWENVKSAVNDKIGVITEDYVAQKAADAVTAHYEDETVEAEGPPSADMDEDTLWDVAIDDGMGYTGEKGDGPTGNAIYNQNTCEYSDVLYGTRPISYNGCELIALYNTMNQLGYHVDFDSVMSECEDNGSIWNDGEWGTEPWSLYKYFDAHDVNYTMYGDINDMHLEDGGVAILSFWNDKDNIPWGMIHTVMVYREGDTLCALNRWGSWEESYKRPSLEELLQSSNGTGKFIVGYVFQ